MDDSVSHVKSRKAKTELESKAFKDGAIYLFKRADYVKPTWFCRVKVPGTKGYVSCSTKTTDEHAAYGRNRFERPQRWGTADPSRLDHAGILARRSSRWRAGSRRRTRRSSR
jgi:hypothetical protein